MKIKSGGFFLIGLSLLLVFSFVSLHGRQATGTEQASLGSSLGKVLPRWRLVSLGLLSPESQSGEEGLTGDLAQLKSSLKNTGFPQETVNRVKPLADKLHAAKNRSLWSYQPGYWSFNQVGSFVVLSGAKIGTISLESRFKSYNYLEFPDRGARATVDIMKKSLKAGSKKFTVELWVNPAGVVSGNLLKTSNWNLLLQNNGLALKIPQGSISGGKLIADTWTHLAVLTDGAKVVVYQNGLKVAQAELKEPLKLGEKLQLGDGFLGKLDELRVRTRMINPEAINFDRPLDYLLGFPIINRVNGNFESDERWNFYAGMLASILKIRVTSEMAAIEPKSLSFTAEFLLGKIENVPRPPEGLPSSVRNNIKRMGKLGRNEELSDEERKEVSSLVKELINYLGLN